MADRRPTARQLAKAAARHAKLGAAVARGERPMQICLHEAAHAVLAHSFGRTIVGIEFDRLGARAGYGAPLRIEPIEEGMIAMAGHAAEVLWCRQPVWAAPKDDDRALRAMGFRGRSFPTLLALAQGQCVELERQIRAVASALKKEDLDRRAFLRALRASGASHPTCKARTGLALQEGDRVKVLRGAFSGATGRIEGRRDVRTLIVRLDKPMKLGPIERNEVWFDEDDLIHEPRLLRGGRHG